MSFMSLVLKCPCSFWYPGNSYCTKPLMWLMSILLMASILLQSPAVAGDHVLADAIAVAGVNAVGGIYTLYAGAEDCHCCWCPECCWPPYCCRCLCCSGITAVASAARDVASVAPLMLLTFMLLQSQRRH
jgi:hypothetical protein